MMKRAYKNINYWSTSNSIDTKNRNDTPKRESSSDDDDYQINSFSEEDGRRTLNFSVNGENSRINCDTASKFDKLNNTESFYNAQGELEVDKVTSQLK